MSSVAPVPRAERTPGIDIARGVARLGIILINARFFFLPLGSAIDSAALLERLERSTLDWAVHDAVVRLWRWGTYG